MTHTTPPEESAQTIEEAFTALSALRLAVPFMGGTVDRNMRYSRMVDNMSYFLKEEEIERLKCPCSLCKAWKGIHFFEKDEK